VFKPLAVIKPRPRSAGRAWHDYMAERRAVEIEERESSIKNSFVTGTCTELMFQNGADYSALASSNSEGSLLSGVNEQPWIPAFFFSVKKKSISLLARGVFSNTGTPTMTFQWRLGSTSGSTYLSGTSVGVSAAITTQSGVSNVFWESRLDLTVYTPGIGSGNTTLAGAGYVMSPAGFAAPYFYPLEPTTPNTATWTATVDDSVTLYCNLSQTWSASSSSNSILTKWLQMWGLN
jgi:hypothetical protein